MTFACDTDTLPPGGWRMSNENERRNRIFFRQPFRDCRDVCEVHPDLEEKTDVVMRVIAIAPELLACAIAVLNNPGEAELDQLRSAVDATKIPWRK